MAVGSTATTPQKTHLMIPWHGVACGFSKRPPWEWPQGHYQVDASALNAVNCQECLNKYKTLQAAGVATSPPSKIQGGVCYALYSESVSSKCALGSCRHGSNGVPHRLCSHAHLKKCMVE